MADEETHDQAPADEQTPPPEPDTGDEGAEHSEGDESTPDGKDSAEYWKKLKRETDQRNKRLTRELENLRRQHMSEQERAVEEARDSGRTEALRELSSRIVDAELRSAAANRPINVDALLANVDRSKFLTDDGEVDRDALNAWLDELAPVQSETRQAGDLGQGARGVNRSSPADVFGQLITGSLK